MEQIAIEFEPTEGGKIRLEDLEQWHFRPVSLIAIEYHLSEVGLDEPLSIDKLNLFFEGQQQEDLNDG